MVISIDFETKIEIDNVYNSRYNNIFELNNFYQNSLNDNYD